MDKQDGQDKDLTTELKEGGLSSPPPLSSTEGGFSNPPYKVNGGPASRRGGITTEVTESTEGGN